MAERAHISQETHLYNVHTQALATVVVVPRERFSYSRQCIEGLYANTDSPFHLVYVDAGSPSRVRRYLEKQARQRGFHLIRTDRYLSPNQARNIGWRAAKTKYVVFLDNEVQVAPGWLSALVQCAEETNASLVGPLYCIGQPVHEVIHMAGGEAGIRLEAGRRRLHESMRFCDQRVSEVLPQLRRQCCELIEFHCLLSRRDLFEQLGPLDEQLLGTREHIDLCLQVRDAGGAVWFEPKAVVTHAPDSIWPTVAPPFRWADIPYYLLRWSDDWGLKSMRHFEQKWDLDAGAKQLAATWLRPHRQVPLRKWRTRLHTVVGTRVGDRLVDALEGFLARGAARKGR